jgi:hypothetical protein
MRKINCLAVLSIFIIINMAACSSTRREQRIAQREQKREERIAQREQKLAQKAEYLERIKGWEYVIVEKKVPHKDCKYIIQEVCGEKGAARCYNWFKERAKFYGGNTVVVTEDVRSQSSAGAGGVIGGSGFGGYKSVQTISAIADYYSCPEYKTDEQK